MSETIRLNLEALAGLEPGTDDFGKMNLKIVMEFALETLDQVAWLAAKAHDMGKVDTPVIGPKSIIKHIASELYDQSVWHAELWADTYENVFPAVANTWTERRFCYETSDGGYWVDMAELKEAYEAAQKEEANA